MCTVTRQPGTLTSDALRRLSRTQTRAGNRRRLWGWSLAMAFMAIFSVSLLLVYLGGRAKQASGGAAEVDTVTDALSQNGRHQQAPLFRTDEPPRDDGLRLPEDLQPHAGAFYSTSSRPTLDSELPVLRELKLIFRKISPEPDADAHDPSATQNTALVVPGNPAFYIGGTGINGAVGEALRKQASRLGLRFSQVEFRYLTSRLHIEALKAARKQKKEIIAEATETDASAIYPVEHVLTFCSPEAPKWDPKTVGPRAATVLLDVLKSSYVLSGNAFNRYLVYVVPPNGKAPADDFYKACEELAYGTVLVTQGQLKQALRNTGFLY